MLSYVRSYPVMVTQTNSNTNLYCYWMDGLIWAIMLAQYTKHCISKYTLCSIICIHIMTIVLHQYKERNKGEICLGLQDIFKFLASYMIYVWTLDSSYS